MPRSLLEAPDREHGRRAGPDDLLCDAADQQAVFAVTPPGPGRDHVGVHLAGVLGNLGHRATLPDGGCDAVGAPRDVGGGRPAALGELLPQLLADRLGGGLDLGAVDDVEGVHPGVEPAGDIEGNLDRTASAGRAVSRDHQRVDHRRIVGADGLSTRGVFHRRPHTPGMDVETVLVPVDGSDESAEAARHGVAVAEQYDATVHVLYVLGEGVVRALETGDVDSGTVADEHRGFVGELRGMAVEAGVGFSVSTAMGFSTTSKRHHPGSVTLDTAEEVEADFIVMPREPATEETADVLEKAAEYVLLYASQPVLSV